MQADNELSKFIEKLKIESELNKDNVIDFFFPTKNIGIIFCKLSEHNTDIVDRNYHRDITHKYENQGIRVIHIFEDEWLTKTPIVKRRIKHILGFHRYTIGARKCEIREITDNSIKKAFCNKYHIQGTDMSSLKIGAYYKNRLVAMMTFGELRASMGRKAQPGHYELYRFCSLGSLFSFPGIAGKLFKYFMEKYNPIEITTYADCRWSDGNLYRKIGFVEVNKSNPNYWYLDKSTFVKRLHRYGFRKSELSKRLKIFDPIKSEVENMRINGYTRIFDSGNYVFKIRKDGVYDIQIKKSVVKSSPILMKPPKSQTVLISVPQSKLDTSKIVQNTDDLDFSSIFDDEKVQVEVFEKIAEKVFEEKKKVVEPEEEFDFTL